MVGNGRQYRTSSAVKCLCICCIECTKPSQNLRFNEHGSFCHHWHLENVTIYNFWFCQDSWLWDTLLLAYQGAAAFVCTWWIFCHFRGVIFSCTFCRLATWHLILICTLFWACRKNSVAQEKNWTVLHLESCQIHYWCLPSYSHFHRIDKKQNLKWK